MAVHPSHLLAPGRHDDSSVLFGLRHLIVHGDAHLYSRQGPCLCASDRPSCTGMGCLPPGRSCLRFPKQNCHGEQHFNHGGDGVSGLHDPTRRNAGVPPMAHLLRSSFLGVCWCHPGVVERQEASLRKRVDTKLPGTRSKHFDRSLWAGGCQSVDGYGGVDCVRLAVSVVGNGLFPAVDKLQRHAEETVFPPK